MNGEGDLKKETLEEKNKLRQKSGNEVRKKRNEKKLKKGT